MRLGGATEPFTSLRLDTWLTLTSLRLDTWSCGAAQLSLRQEVRLLDRPMYNGD
jgi:hypothetical protein